jgi:hypothetical protein
MKKSSIFLTIITLFTFNLIEGQKVKINGMLFDKDERKIIGWGLIFLNSDNLVTTVNQNGEFSFTCNPGRIQISTKVLGYKPFLLSFNAKSDTLINIYVPQFTYTLNEVIVMSDSSKNLQITPQGSFILNSASVRETPRLFSEPDLLKSFQMLPGVVSGKDGTTDIYVRGGGMGQNIILANGCYFFLPGHLLGIVSPFDMDFLESAELFKDYFPSELGGGASSVISLYFKKTHSDSIKAQIRLGLLSSGIVIEIPFKKHFLNLTAGLRRGNYSLYGHLLKKTITYDVADFLPPSKYSFYDGFIRLSHNSLKWGKIDYLFFGNYDRGKDETSTKSRIADTLTKYTDLYSSGWNSMVHAFTWTLPVKNTFIWQLNLNYNRLSTGRDLYKETLTSFGKTELSESSRYLFSPTINSIGSTLNVTSKDDKLSYSAGISQRFRIFSPNIEATNTINDTVKKTEFGKNSRIYEPALFASSTYLLTDKLKIDAGFRLSGGFAYKTNFMVFEPRLRISYIPFYPVSPHINYVRLSQFDHSVEGSNAGLRSMLWIPVSGDFGPEISDVLSAGLQGQINHKISWSLDGYYKKTRGMTDYKPGASFIFDSSFVDMLDKVKGRAYGLEAGVIKNTGNFTYNLSYTYSRSKIEWSTPEGLIWIPANSDRPHNFNLALRWHIKERTSFGLNWVYQSGSPATIYMHTTSYGELLDTKNNIRYFDYHRLDLSFRRTIYKRKYSIFIDLDIYNVYNRKNTFYFREVYDDIQKRYYYKSISLFPIMPSLSLTVKN